MFDLSTAGGLTGMVRTQGANIQLPCA